MASVQSLVALTPLAWHLLQVFLVLLGKAHVPHELGIDPLRDLYLCDLGFLMLFACHFQDRLCVVRVLNLAMAGW